MSACIGFRAELLKSSSTIVLWHVACCLLQWGTGMSTKGIYTAVSGAIAQSQRLDTIANNIANANTTGFKRDEQVFNEYLTAYEKQDDVINVPRIPASIESFYDMQGGDRGYVNSAGTYTSHEQGQLKPTSSNLDFAIEGAGFFEVSTPNGAKLTRNGSFKIDPSGMLVTKDGLPVLREGIGQPPETRTIRLTNPNVTVSNRGDIYDGGNLIGRLSLVDVNDKDGLQKVGNGLYQLKTNSTEALKTAQQAKVQQGFLEGSNINIVREMTDMIQASRIFETNNQAIKAFDQMDEKMVRDIPKL